MGCEGGGEEACFMSGHIVFIPESSAVEVNSQFQIHTECLSPT